MSVNASSVSSADKCSTHLIGIQWGPGTASTPSAFYLYEYPTGRERLVPYDPIYKLYQTGKNTLSFEPILGIKLSDDGLSLVGSNGTFTRYPKYSRNKLEPGKIIILKNINTTPPGYVCYITTSAIGIKKLTESSIISLTLGPPASKFPIHAICNGKVVTRDDTGAQYISSIRGEYGDMVIPASSPVVAVPSPVAATPSPVVATSAPTVATPTQEVAQPSQPKHTLQEKVASYQAQQKAEREQQLSEPKELVPLKRDGMKKRIDGRFTGEAKNDMRRLLKHPTTGEVGYFEDVKDTSDYMTPEKQLALIIGSIKAVRPFYAASLKALKIVESDEIPTACVSVDTLYFNPRFILEMSVSEGVFVFMHEVGHIMMRHHSRGRGKHAQFWNVATDLFINKDLADCYKCPPGASEQIMDPAIKAAKIRFVEGGLYEGTIDIKTDTPESIYAELMRENNLNDKGQRQQQSDDSSQQGQQQGEGQQGAAGSQGQQGQEEQEEQEEQQQEQGAAGSQGQGQQQQGQQGASGSQQGTQQQGQGAAGSSQGDNDSSNDVTFRGKKVGRFSDEQQDLVDDYRSAYASDEANDAKEKANLEKATTIHKQITESTNKQGKGKGSDGVLENLVAWELVPRVNWRSLVSNILTSRKIDDKSLSTPDRRFVHHGLYIEGDREEEEKLEGLKLCIDTSGSMSDEDIGIAIRQIMQLCSLFHTQADLVYWDDGIQSITPFDKLDMNDLKKYQATGRGGTDPNCIFEEFSKKEYLYGKKVPPSLVIIFTDGYFQLPDNKYRRLFHTKTVWVLCSTNSNSNFTPNFGKKAYFINKK